MRTRRLDALQVFATASFGEIRLWHIHTCRELLRVKVPNVACHCLAFSADGSAVISGWSDGKIRAFGPQSGKLLYTIEAHHKGVRSIAATKDPQRLLSGGEEGIVRVWQVWRRTLCCCLMLSVQDQSTCKDVGQTVLLWMCLGHMCETCM